MLFLFPPPADIVKLYSGVIFFREFVDIDGPVLRLSNLTPEDFFILIGKIRHVFAFGDPAAYLLPDDGLKAFMEHCSKRIGDAYFRTPRTTITAFVNLLSVLEQNKDVKWQDLIGTVEVKKESNPDLEPLAEEVTGTAEKGDTENLASFKL